MKSIHSLSSINMKFIMLICIFMQILFLYEIHLHPTKGYELSIYEGIPFIGYLFLVTGLFISFFLIFSSANSTDKYIHYMGYFFLLSYILLFLNLPLLRGYVAYASIDQFVHIGYVIDVINTNHLSPKNIYPVTHILVSTISILLNVNPLKLINTIPAFGMILFILSSTILSKLFFNGKIVVFASLVSSLCLFGTSQTLLYPHFLSIELIPFFFYLVIKAKYPKNLNYTILLVIFLFLVPFLYPLTSLIIIVYLVFIEYFLPVLIRDKHMSSLKSISTFDKNCILISIIIFLIWYSNFSAFEDAVARVFNGIFFGEHIQLEKGMETLSSIQLVDKVQLLLKLYSDNFIMLFLSLFAVIRIFSHYVQTKKVNLEILPSVLFLITFPLMLILFFSTQSQTLMRFINSGYYNVFVPILSGYTLMRFYNHLKSQNFVFKNVTISLLILLITAISFSGVYHSPYILHPSLGISNQYYEGTEWLLTSKVVSKNVLPIGIIPAFHYAIVGFNDGNFLIKYSDIPLIEKPTYSEINLSSVNDEYIMKNSIFELAMNNKVLYNKGINFAPLFMKKTRISETDCISNINKIYENGELIILVT